MVEAMVQRTFWFVKIFAIICHFSWLSQTKCRAYEAVHNYQQQNFVIFSGGLLFCFVLDFFGFFFPQVWNEDLLLCVCLAFQFSAELQPFRWNCYLAVRHTLKIENVVISDNNWQGGPVQMQFWNCF